MTASKYLKETKDKRMKELFKFLSFPSVSAKSEHKKDLVDCADWLVKHLKGVGFKAKKMPTGGHPVVYAEYLVDKSKPTVLYYGHYDVQPAEPFELWKSPPFKPEIRGGKIFARGASDDKGQTFCHIKGLEAVIKSSGTLPVNVKMLIEGEEEVASENLPSFIKKNKKMLQADVVVVSDTAMYDPKTPAVTYGLRGIVAAEVFVHGPNKDIHSGNYGGAVGNPVNILCDMIAQLHDKNGKVAIPGFYKDVKPMTKFEKQQYKKLPFDEAAYKKEIGVPALQGEKGYSPLERVGSRPTLDINGITGGYQGEGAKTIIPSVASAKITCRLVPNQDHSDIAKKLKKHLEKIAPKSVKVKVDVFGGGARAVATPTDSPWLDAANLAIKKAYGKEPVFIKTGGSIPIVGDFKRILGLDTLLIGFGQENDNIHSPNERFRVTDFERGCKTAAALPEQLAKVAK